MSDEITPSKNELKAAELTWSYRSVHSAPGEILKEKAEIIAAHTRHEGRTAKEWKERHDIQVSLGCELADIKEEWKTKAKSLQARLTAAEESLKAIVDEDPFDSCRATRIAKAYLATRKSGKTEK